MHKGRSCDQRVHRMYGAPARLQACRNATPLITDRPVNENDPLFKPPWKFAPQPPIELSTAAPLRQPLNSVAQLGNNYDA